MLAVRWKHPKAVCLSCHLTDGSTTSLILSLVEPADWLSGITHLQPVHLLDICSPDKSLILSRAGPTNGTAELTSSLMLLWLLSQLTYQRARCWRPNTIPSRRLRASVVLWCAFSFPEVPISLSRRTHTPRLTQKMSGIAEKVNTRPIQIASESIIRELIDLDHADSICGDERVGYRRRCDLKQVSIIVKLALKGQEDHNTLVEARTWRYELTQTT